MQKIKWITILEFWESMGFVGLDEAQQPMPERTNEPDTSNLLDIVF